VLGMTTVAQPFLGGACGRPRTLRLDCDHLVPNGVVYSNAYPRWRRPVKQLGGSWGCRERRGQRYFIDASEFAEPKHMVKMCCCLPASDHCIC
jgi:hypothetical protein